MKEFSIDLRGRPTVTAGSDHYFPRGVRPSVPIFQNPAKQNFYVSIVIATRGTVGLASGSLM